MSEEQETGDVESEDDLDGTTHRQMVEETETEQVEQVDNDAAAE